MKLLNTLCELIFPKLCLICNEPLYEAPKLCLACESKLPYYPFNLPGKSSLRNKFWGINNPTECFAMLQFAQGTICQDILHLIKYNNQQALAIELGREMALKMNSNGFTKPTVLIPVPIHKKKKQIRGYNQAALLAKGMALVWNIPIQNALKRIKHATSQTSLNREKRWENLKDTYILTSKIASEAHILLVDDVLTTGATLSHCLDILNYQKCSIATLAVSD